MMLLWFIGATLTLDEALANTERAQPAVQRARAELAAQEARERRTRGELLPQLAVTGVYTRQTGNFLPRPGAVPESVAVSRPPTTDTFDFVNFGATLTQQVYDFHQTIGRYQAQMRLSEASAHSADQSLVTAFLDTRRAYFDALARKALVAVAEDNVQSLTKQLEHAEAQTQVGRRPQIDVLQAKQQLSTGRLDRIRRQNDLRLSKLRLNQTMGVIADADYDIADVTQVALPEESMTGDALTEIAIADRPDIAAIDSQIQAQEATIVSQRGRFAPTLGMQFNVTEAARSRSWQWIYNFGFQATLSWNLFSGLQDYYGWREAQATKHALEAQKNALVIEARRVVDEARLTVLAAREAIGAADDAVAAATERMALAEGRYTTGVGTGLEIADARFQLTQANANRVQAGLELALARASLLAALGRTR